MESSKEKETDPDEDILCQEDRQAQTQEHEPPCPNQDSNLDP